MIIFDGLRGETRTIRMRGRRPECPLCGTKKITALVDYVQFCQAGAHDKSPDLDILPQERRLDPNAINFTDSMLIDVRTEVEYVIGNIAKSFYSAVNIPLKKLKRTGKEIDDMVESNKGRPIVLVCRRGNDSQLAVKELMTRFPEKKDIFDIRGGLYAWNEKVDLTFPLY